MTTPDSRSVYPGWLRPVANHAPTLVPIALVALLGIILVPLPPVLLDLLIVANLALSAVILLTTFQVRSPLDFSVFPSLLLAVTLLRLVLNIASTRLILTADAADPEGATRAAGRVIESFGQFVAGGSVVIGAVLFLILIIVQFVVITKGGTRISEVAARFTLDSMPGKQMSIDADLNSGLITEAQARLRREEVSREADFYGAMDGASKFVRGDAIAGLIITLINIIGGFAVGVFDRGWPMADTLSSFTRLTIGDGLAAQIPAFITALAAGLIVTRSGSRGDLGREMTGQLTAQPLALGVAAALIASLAFLGLPPVPMLTIAAMVGALAYYRSRAPEARLSPAAASSEPPAAEDARAPSFPNPPLDALELEIGYGLVRLADARQGGDLLDQIASLRREIAQDLGLVIPSVRVHDNIALPPHAYRIKLRGNAIADGLLDSDGADGLLSHLAQTVKAHAAELLTREQTETLLAQLREKSPKLVEEVIGPTQGLRPGDLRKVLQNLLRERVPIRDLETIVEALGDWSGHTTDPELLTEYARHALRRTISHQYAEGPQDPATAPPRLYCVTLAPGTEELIAGYIERGGVGAPGVTPALPPRRAQGVVEMALAELEKLTAMGHHPVILTSPRVRSAVRRLIEPHLPTVAVLGYGELDGMIEVESVGLIEIDPMGIGAVNQGMNGGRLHGALN